MTTLYVLRHAEKEHGDFFGRRLRHQDEPLTARGLQAAKALVAFFERKDIAAIYVSGYRRTLQTIEPLAGRLGIPPVIDERLNEIDNGRLDGMTEEEIQQQYPDIWRAFQKQDKDFRFPDGETGAEVEVRIGSLLEEKRLQHQGQNVVFVSHEGLMRVLACHILGLPASRRWHFRVDFCGLMEITYLAEPGFWQLLRFNQDVALAHPELHP